MTQHEQYYACQDCIKDKDIRTYFANNPNVKISNCVICGKTKSCTSSSDKNFIRMARSLIRYHYPEYEYNPHWGAESGPESLLRSENPIFSIPEIQNEEFELFVEELMYGLDGEHEISLYAGNDEYGRDLFPRSLKTEGTKIWKEITNEITQKNHDKKLNEFLDRVQISSLATECAVKINLEQHFYRARIGFNKIEQQHEFHDYKISKKEPYRNNEITAPPAHLAPSGRANKEGISYYYLASDIETTLSEVRPHPGEYVTVGIFDVNQSVNIANLIDTNLIDYSKSINGMNTYTLIKEITREFENPVTPKSSDRYIRSQFISDMFKQLGFDGIAFNSSVGIGFNLVIFDHANVTLINNSEELYKIKKHAYAYGLVQTKMEHFFGEFVEDIS